MRINGVWQTCDDGVVRPVMRAQIRTAGGIWVSTWFLVDTGADCTAFCADDLTRLGFPTRENASSLGGVGGVAQSVVVDTQIRLRCDDGSKATFRGEYAAFTQPESLDISVLGRDVMDLFSLVVDRLASLVSLIRDRHTYRIETS